jgi:hypothetical protein
MKNEEINQQEENEKKEWNAPQINELGIDNTKGGLWVNGNENDPVYHKVS